MSLIFSSEGKKAWLPKLHREHQTASVPLPPGLSETFLSYILKLQNEALIPPRDPGSPVYLEASRSWNSWDMSTHRRHLGAWGLDPQPNTFFVTSAMHSACLRFWATSHLAKAQVPRAGL